MGGTGPCRCCQKAPLLSHGNVPAVKSLDVGAPSCSGGLPVSLGDVFFVNSSDVIEVRKLVPMGNNALLFMAEFKSLNVSVSLTLFGNFSTIN
jgi:hypothetical protein